MAARKAVRTISISGVGDGFGLVSATTDNAYSTEADAISAYGDTYVTNVPRSEGIQFGDLSFEFLNEGTEVPDTIAGTVQSITITTKYGDGKTAEETKAVTLDLSVKAVTPGSVSVDGERKDTFTISGVRHSKADRSA